MNTETRASTIANLRAHADRARKDGNEARAKELEDEALLYESEVKPTVSKTSDKK